ncbi:hypothetical protein D9758_000034 [Tetrapyrgos nigripes]|uniref:ZZ-type domain-containing protein n=1 Tax=Tetrapyrgos nigripes TaxID=182062 RepID=A0A8H5H1Y5_9AGAR|nr:hypothetical protein D9758_000034 [Tetrapyrgos nigripes]
MRRIFRRSKSQSTLKTNKPLPEIYDVPPVPSLPQNLRQLSLPLSVQSAPLPQSDRYPEPWVPSPETMSTDALPVVSPPVPEQQIPVTEKDSKIMAAYNVVNNTAQTSKREQKVDKIVTQMNKAITESSDNATNLNTWFMANSAVLSSAGSILANIDSKTVDTTITKFSETTKVVMDGLTALQQIHPFLGAAIFAFKGVISLTMTRIANNKKVLVLHATMQETLMVLFHVRGLKDPTTQVPGTNETVQGLLGGIIEEIAESIKETGSALDHYVKKGFLAKTLKSTIYEERLAGYAATFVKHKENLEHRLIISTARGVDTANDKLDEQGTRMKSMEDTQQQMLKMLQSLTTQREKEIQSFVTEYAGGAKSCIDDERLLSQLVQMSGESAEEIAGTVPGRLDNEKLMEKVQKNLTSELLENLNDALERNRRTFDRKLEAQLKQLKRIEQSIHEESNRVIDEFHRGPHDRIKDKELKAIWQYMGWKGSVKARHFVLGLHDHYAAQRTVLPSHQGQLEPTTPSVDAVTPTVEAMTPFPGTGGGTGVRKRVRREDLWALAYLNVSRVQPILEAVDDDGTGFISIKEVNDFTESRPSEWTLPVWLAYWSQGWHESMNRYKLKIALIMQLFLAEITQIKAENRVWAEEYMNDWGINRVDSLLRSLRAVNAVSGADDIKLKNFAQEYTVMEEQRLKEKLEEFRYVIDEVETVSLITGPGRLERYILPLLYLILKRHLAITKLAKNHIFNSEEFWSMSETIWYLFKALDERIINLVEIFKQTHVDEDQRLRSYALGLLYLPWKETSWNPNLVKFVPWPDSSNPTTAEVLSDVEQEEGQVTLDNLVYGPENYTELGALSYASEVIWDNTEESTAHSHPLVGPWSGYLQFPDGDISNAVDTTLSWIWVESVDEEGNVSGKCDTALLPLTLSGKMTSDHQIDWMLRTGENCTQIIGRFDADSQTIIGLQFDKTTIVNAEENDKKIGLQEQPDAGTKVFFCRTPVDVYRFRYTPEQLDVNPARVRWVFACQAVLYQVRQRAWSRSYFQTVLPERLQLVRFAAQHLAEERNWTPHSPYLPLSNEERSAFQVLLKVVPPTAARFYTDFARFQLSKNIIDFLGYSCDGCDKHIVGYMLSCLECVDDMFNHRIDLCSECMSNDTKTERFSHSVSHLMLRANDHIMHDGEMVHYFSKGKEVGLRVKKTFQQQKQMLLADMPSDSKLKLPETKCCYCLKPVSTPCWTCADCVIDTYVCDGCENGAVVKPASHHTEKHTLVRIHDSVVAETVDSPVEDSSETYTVLWEKIEGLEDRLNTQLASLETRFTAMETLLGRLVEATLRQQAVGERS